MSKLIVSVRNPVEARLAFEAGADVVDLKEPTRGSLGAIDPAVALQVSTYFNSLETPESELNDSDCEFDADCEDHAQPNLPKLSLALGELSELDLDQDFSFAQDFQYAKVGLANCSVNSDRGESKSSDQEPWHHKLRFLQSKLPIGTELVAVYYVDANLCSAPSFDAVLHFAFLHDLPVVLFDTFDKDSGSIFDFHSTWEIKEMRKRAAGAGLKLALAGSIRFEHIAKVSELDPDFVAIRSAICRGARTANIDSELLHRFIDKMRVVEEEQLALRQSAMFKTAPTKVALISSK